MARRRVRRVVRRASRKLPYTVQVVLKQRGRTVMRVDRKIRAMKPGKRISKSRRKYWETRANRSDRSPKRRL